MIGGGVLVLIGVVVVILIVTDVFSTTAKAPAPAKKEEKKEKEEEATVLETQTDKCFVGDDVEINCLPPTGLNGKDYYTYAKVKQGSTESMRKVPCTLTTQCIVPPGASDFAIALKPNIRTDIKAAEGSEGAIFRTICEADYNCTTDPIYETGLFGDQSLEIMERRFRSDCHDPPALGSSCIDIFFNLMKPTAWKPNPELTLSGQALQEVRRMAREKQVPEPSIKLTDPEIRALPTITMDRFKNQCEAKGYEFAKNCKTPCSGTRFSGSCPPGISSAPSPAPSAGAPRKEIDQSVRFHIAGMPQVHDYQLSLRRLADHYTVA